MATSLFNTTITGSGSTGLETWINLGNIPTGLSIWIGSATYSTGNISLTFELRSNIAGQSIGTTAATSILDSAAVKAKSSVTHDLYKQGALHTATIIGSGIEKWWLRIKSTKSTSNTYSYKISYTTN